MDGVRVKNIKYMAMAVIFLVVLTFIVVSKGMEGMEGVNECSSKCMQKDMTLNAYVDGACYCDNLVKIYGGSG